MTAADETRQALEQATGEVLDTDEKQIQALMRMSAGAMGHAEASDELRIMRGEFPEDSLEMA